MGYLDKSTITVDAILTNRGRELLSKGTGTSAFDIVKYAIADDEVDYGLYNVAHPLGSNYYGAVIENMPVLEATPDETQTMRYKLVTVTGADLNNGSVIIPQILLGTAGVNPGQTVSLYYSPTEGEGQLILSPSTTITATSNLAEQYTLVLSNWELAQVFIGTTGTTEVVKDGRGSIVATGASFRIKAKNRTGQTAVAIYGINSGAVYNFTLSTVASS